MELEDTGRGKWKERALQYAGTHQMLEQFTEVPRRKALFIGLTASTSVIRFVPMSMVRVLLLPPPDEHRRRYEERSRIADNLLKIEQKAMFPPSDGTMERQRQKKMERHAREAFGRTKMNASEVAALAALREEFDIIVTSAAGCAEQSLVDLSKGVLSWLDAAPIAPALAHRWALLREHYGFNRAGWLSTTISGAAVAADRPLDLPA